MRSVSYTRFGEASKVLDLIDTDLPQPGPGQIRVKLLLSPIHNHDLMTILGVYGTKPNLPAVPGTEAVGVVDALGEGVSHLSVGQRVTGGANQAWADYYLADAQRSIVVPDSVDDATASQLISMPLSAKMLLADLNVPAGAWIIQNAANGAVGKLLNRFAAEAGVHVVNLVRRDAGIAELASLGIGNTISTETDGWQQRVADVTGGAPIVAGLDSIGGDGPDALLGVMADRSEVISFGNLSGKKLMLSSDTILFKQAVVRGFWAARPKASAEAIGKMIGELVADAKSGKLVLPVEAVFDLADAKAAALANGEPGRKGKIALASKS